MADEEETGVRKEFTKRELEMMVREQIAQDNIRDAIDGRYFWRNVLFAALAGIIGILFPYYISQLISEAVEQGSIRSAQRSDALRAVREFSVLVSEQQSKMNAVRETAFRGGSRSAALEKWREYERAYLNWQAQLEENKLYFRDFLGFSYPNFMEHAIGETLDKHFRIYRHCLAQDFRERFGDTGVVLTGSGVLVVEAAEGSVPRTSVDGLPDRFHSCLSRQSLLRLGVEKSPLRFMSDLRTCQSEIHSILNHFVMRNLHCGNQDTWRGRTDAGKPKVELYYESLMNKCNVENYTSLEEHEDAAFLSQGVYKALCAKIEDPWYQPALTALQ